MKRIENIDLLRGIVMIIMALDHVRDLIHVDSITQSPTDLSTTSPALFFTRMITHLCAPTFVFLSGVSVYMQFIKNRHTGDLSVFLLKRGIWLLVLELTIVNFGLFFDIGFHTSLFQVIATIGVGFMLLALFIHVPVKVLTVLALCIILLHNLVSFIPFEDNALIKTILTPLFTTTVYQLSSTHILFIAYAPVPWFGIMLLGFCLGSLFLADPEKRKSSMLKASLVSIFLFLIVRLINTYGDPVPWQIQNNTLFTFLSFLNVTKYPPSLLFISLTLSLMFFLLYLTEYSRSRLTQLIITYGRVPLFYFIIHFYWIHMILLLILFIQGFTWSDLAFSTGTFGRPVGVSSGLNLWAVYLIWIFVVISLYKPCRWYGRLKATQHKWWYQYL